MLSFISKYTTQTMTCPIVDHKWPAKRSSMFSISWNGQQNLITLWTSHASHHHGIVRFQVSDRKLVKHTTEMILRSMILLVTLRLWAQIAGTSFLFLLFSYYDINLAFLKVRGIGWAFIFVFKTSTLLLLIRFFLS